MKKFIRVIICIAILLGGFAISALLWITKPEAEKVEQKDTAQTVKVIPIERENRSFTIPSQGIVEADRRATLSSEVAGRVIEVKQSFETGSKVTEEEVLIRLDPTDFEASRAQANALLLDAISVLASEEARAEQAVSDWTNMGRGGTPSDLVLRKPQLASASARVESARSALKKAEHDLKRTEIRAPFDAIIAKTFTEKGNYLTPGSPVAEVFESGPYEVRLPVSVDELTFLEGDENGRPTGKAVIQATAAGITRSWDATISRSDGEIDRETRSLYLIATIESPKDASGIEVRPGLFVDASITGREISDVVSVPFSSFTDIEAGRFHVVVVDLNDTLRFREVTVVYRDGDEVYVLADFITEEKFSDNLVGFRTGDRICVTEVPDIIEGNSVIPVFASPSELNDSDSPVDTTISTQL